MSEVTQEQIDEAIKNCYWLSDNQPGYLVEGVCTGNLGSCMRIIDSGKCDTLRELFSKQNNK